MLSKTTSDDPVGLTQWHRHCSIQRPYILCNVSREYRHYHQHWIVITEFFVPPVFLLFFVAATCSLFLVSFIIRQKKTAESPIPYHLKTERKYRKRQWAKQKMCIAVKKGKTFYIFLCSTTCYSACYWFQMREQYPHPRHHNNHCFIYCLLNEKPVQGTQHAYNFCPVCIIRMPTTTLKYNHSFQKTQVLQAAHTEVSIHPRWLFLCSCSRRNYLKRHHIPNFSVSFHSNQRIKKKEPNLCSNSSRAWCYML